MRFIVLLAVLIGGGAYGWRMLEAQTAPPPTNGPVQRTLGDCELPQPSAEAVMVFAGYYEGAAISTVRLAAKNSQEEATTAVDVNIAPGFKPIYLVIVGDRPSILRFSGWTARLEKLVVVTDGAYPTGVAGLPADRLVFADRHDCGVQGADFYDTPQGPSEDLTYLVRRPAAAKPADGAARELPEYRMPDAVGGAYSPASLTIGAGVSAKEYRAHEHASGLSALELLGADFTPAGVKEVSLAALVAPVPASRYEVLPGWAGLGQLVSEGKLESRGSGRFRVLAPIKAPAGLYGSQSVTFELAPGVPRPSGDLGHSRID